MAGNLNSHLSYLSYYYCTTVGTLGTAASCNLVKMMLHKTFGSLKKQLCCTKE